MKKLLLAVTCLFAFVCPAQTYQPITQPRQHYVDLSGNPCAGCKIYSYAAGTTTPQPTYTDASGAHQNTNPIILDAAGGANIWIGQSAYKFALLDTFGTTLWTVDQVLAPAPGNQGTAYLPLAGGTMSGNIAMAGNNLLNAGNIGVGTSTPNWPIDVESGSINASAGFLYAGIAPLNHILLGNGSDYIDSATFPYASLTGLPTLYYQTVDSSGTGQTQRPTLNFDSTLSVTDSASPAQTNVGLPNKGTAGSCTYCNVTFDAQGRETAYSTGTIPGTDQWVTFTSCIPASDGDNQVCQGGPISWSVAFADTSYYIDSCMVDDTGTYTSNPPPTAFVQFHNKTTTGFSYTLTDVKGSSGPYPYTWPVTCHAHHP